MVNNPFTSYATTPSLGATDFAHIMGAGFVIGMGGMEARTQPKVRGPLMTLLRKLAGFGAH